MTITSYERSADRMGTEYWCKWDEIEGCDQLVDCLDIGRQKNWQPMAMEISLELLNRMKRECGLAVSLESQGMFDGASYRARSGIPNDLAIKFLAPDLADKDRRRYHSLGAAASADRSSGRSSVRLVVQQDQEIDRRSYEEKNPEPMIVEAKEKRKEAERAARRKR